MTVVRKSLSELGVRPSMMARRASNGNLATERVAATLAEAVIEAEYGPEEVALQLPLKISDTGDVWTIEGSRVPVTQEEGGRREALGSVVVVIAKIDCQILDFFQNMRWAPLVQGALAQSANDHSDV